MFVIEFSRSCVKTENKNSDLKEKRRIYKRMMLPETRNCLAKVQKKKKIHVIHIGMLAFKGSSRFLHFQQDIKSVESSCCPFHELRLSHCLL